MDLFSSDILITGLSWCQRWVDIIAETKTDLKVALNQKKEETQKKAITGKFN